MVAELCPVEFLCRVRHITLQPHILWLFSEIVHETRGASTCIADS